MPETKTQTGNPVFNDFYPRFKKFLQADVSEFVLDGKLMRGYRGPDSKSIWLRDHRNESRVTGLSIACHCDNRRTG